MIIPNPTIRQVEGCDELYELTPFDYEAILSDNKKLTIKSGYIYDGASIPRILWSLIGSPFQFSYAIVHDALYQSELLTRSESDSIFIEILKLKGVGFLKRNSMYIGLRLGGWVTWNSHTQESIKEARKFITLEDAA